MVIYPECQMRAQQEIDSVIGSERLPTFDDRASLPYVEAVMQESLRCVFQLWLIINLTSCHRWHSSSPLGMSHHLLLHENGGSQ